MTPALLGALACKARTGGGKGAFVGSSDPEIGNVVALLHMNGTDGSTTIIDVKGHSFNPNGNAQLDTAQFKFGTASLLLDGTGDFINSTASVDWKMGSGDFTVELWARWNALPASGTSDCLVNFIDNAGAFAVTTLQVDNVAGQLKLFWYIDLTSSTPFIYVNWVPTTNVWYHIAGLKSGDLLRLYVDGTLLDTATGATGTVRDNAPQLWIGQGFTATNPFNGWLDEVRITRGIARYGSSFTPSSTEFSDV